MAGILGVLQVQVAGNEELLTERILDGEARGGKAEVLQRGDSM
jgi:hypothetical protein